MLKISPNSALLFLKPADPTFAMLFEVVEISVWAPFKPVSAVKKDMFNSY